MKTVLLISGFMSLCASVSWAEDAYTVKYKCASKVQTEGAPAISVVTKNNSNALFVRAKTRDGFHYIALHWTQGGTGILVYEGSNVKLNINERSAKDESTLILNPGPTGIEYHCSK